MRLKHLPLLGAIALSAPSFAVTVNMTDFYFPGSPRNVTVNGGSTGPSYSGAAGEFSGTMTFDEALASSPTQLRAAAAPEASPTSFQAWCTEITQTFSFGTTYTYDLDTAAGYYQDGRGTALSRLFTAAQGFVTDAVTAAAFQAGIWEIVYEKGPSYDLTGGTFTGFLNDADGLTAFNTVNYYLTHLSSYNASYRIDILESDSHQDFIVATIPEPETWAMLVAGFGVLGWAARRRKARATA